MVYSPRSRLLAGRPARRVYLATGSANLYALDARTGQPAAEFGDDGRIDLTEGLRRPVDRDIYTSTSPPLVCRDVVVGSSATDFEKKRDLPPGDVRGFDARSGELKWLFQSVPQEGETGVETWENESWKEAGNTNVWTVMSCDPELGLVYLFAESVVALNVETGDRVWHYQIVHHGLWDYDLPTPPILGDLTVEGRRIAAAIQVTKQGLVFTFHRKPGSPSGPFTSGPYP